MRDNREWSADYDDKIVLYIALSHDKYCYWIILLHTIPTAPKILSMRSSKRVLYFMLRDYCRLRGMGQSSERSVIWTDTDFSFAFCGTT